MKDIFTPKFILYYVLAMVVAMMCIVISRVAPSLLEDWRLNRELESGNRYFKRANPIYYPSIEDFILEDDGELHLDDFYPTRSLKEKWSISDVEKYWDSMDPSDLEDLSRKNQKMLEEQVEKLP